MILCPYVVKKASLKPVRRNKTNSSSLKLGKNRKAAARNEMLSHYIMRFMTWPFSYTSN